MNEFNAPQPPPVPNDERPVWEAVIEDMRERDLSGYAKYGVRLQPFNGRKTLIDAYQELLDLVVYVKKELLERARLEAYIKELELKTRG